MLTLVAKRADNLKGFNAQLNAQSEKTGQGNKPN
jgi:hypothetical protein